MITALSFGNNLLKFNNYVLDATGVDTIDYYYATKLNAVSNGYDVPIYTELSSNWARPAYTNSSAEQSGTLPASYVGFNALKFGTGNGNTGKLPLRGLDEFTISFWCKADGSISGACQFCELRMHSSHQYTMAHLDDSSLSALSNATVTLLNGTTLESTRVWNLGNTSSTTKTTWHYYQIYVNRTQRKFEYYMDGTCYLRFTDVPASIIQGDSSTLDERWYYYADASYYGKQMLMDLVIFKGSHIGIPTSPVAV